MTKCEKILVIHFVFQKKKLRLNIFFLLKKLYINSPIQIRNPENFHFIATYVSVKARHYALCHSRSLNFFFFTAFIEIMNTF